MTTHSFDLSEIETAGAAAMEAQGALSSAVTAMARDLCYTLPRDLDFEGLHWKCRKSNVGSGDYLVWTRDDSDDNRHVYLEEKAYADTDAGRYQHGDFHCWIPAPTHDDKRAFAEAVAGGLLVRLAAHLRDRAARDARLTATVESARA